MSKQTHQSSDPVGNVERGVEMLHISEPVTETSSLSSAGRIIALEGENHSPRVINNLACQPSNSPMKLELQLHPIDGETQNEKQNLKPIDLSKKAGSLIIPEEVISNISTAMEDIKDISTDWKKILLAYNVGGKISAKKVGQWTPKWRKPVTFAIHSTGWLLCRFNSEEDKEEIFTNGPYRIDGKMLVLRKVPSNFKYDQAEMTKAPIWVKMPNLPINMWNKRAFSKILSVIGRPLQADEMTVARKGYARALVEVDITKDIPSSIPIRLPSGEAMDIRVEPEFQPRYCTHCENLGHLLSRCRKRRREAS